MPKKHLSLRIHDLMRQHHPNDASADVAQRAMLDAQARHSRQNSINAIVKRAGARFKKRASAISRQREGSPMAEHPTPSQWQLYLSSDDFAAFMCRVLKIDLMSLDAAHWLKEIRVMSNTQIASLIRACMPAATDEWEQDGRRHEEKELSDVDKNFTAELLRFLELAPALQKPTSEAA